MSTTTAPSKGASPDFTPGFRPGPLGRLGLWVTNHAKLVTGVWLLLIVGLGAFAPQVEHNLSGAGWQADGSESVAARELAQESFGGNASSAIQVVVHSTDGPVTEGPGAEVLARVTRMLEAEARIADVIAPMPGATISQDGSTAIILAGAGADTNEMVRVATDLKGDLQDLSVEGIQVNPTGSSLLWSDFNEANLEAMLKSEMVSWPVTMAILVLAFGALVAAGLPLILTLAGLVASAGSLVLINELVPVSTSSVGTPELTRNFVRRELGEVAVDTPAARELHETVAVYLSCDRGLTKAAEVLRVARNKIAYRVKKAGALIGRDLRDRRPELESALRLAQRLGASVHDG